MLGGSGNPYVQAAGNIARQLGIPPWLFLGLVRQESGFNPNARSSAGAIGLTQLMPATARGLGVNPYNPMQNLRGGARYLLDQYRRFGNWRLALAAYNAGPGAVAQYHGIPPYGETQAYVRSIFGNRALPGSPGSYASAGMSSPSGALGFQMPTLQGLPSLTLSGQGFGPASQPIGLPSPLGTAPPALQALTTPSIPTLQLPQLASYQMPTLPGTPPGSYGLRGSKASSGYYSPAGYKGGRSLGFIEHFAAPYGLTITATTNGNHVTGSYHYLGRAVDFSGDPRRMAALAWAAVRNPGLFSEMFYAGPGHPNWFIKNGRLVPLSQLSRGLYVQHENHVHLAR